MADLTGRVNLSSRSGFPSRRSPSLRTSSRIVSSGHRLEVLALTFAPSVVGVAVSGAGFYLWRLSQGSEVVWDRSGDWRPWDKIKQDQNVSRVVDVDVRVTKSNPC